MHALLLLGLLDAQGHEDFWARETATALLIQQPGWTRPLLQLTVRTHPDPEVRWRSRDVLTLQVQCLIDDLGELPWLDMLPDDYDKREQLLQAYVPWHGRMPLLLSGRAYRAATRAYFANMLAHGCSLDEVRHLQQLMWKKQNEWTKQHGMMRHMLP